MSDGLWFSEVWSYRILRSVVSSVCDGAIVLSADYSFLKSEINGENFTLRHLCVFNRYVVTLNFANYQFLNFKKGFNFLLAELQHPFSKSFTNNDVIKMVSCFSGVIKGEGVLPDDSLNATLGASVTFSTTVPPQAAPFALIDWKFNDKTIIFFNENIQITPGYEDKVNVSLSTGALELTDLLLNDSGRYRVIITPRQQSSQEGAITLNVYGG